MKKQLSTILTCFILVGLSHSAHSSDSIQLKGNLPPQIKISADTFFYPGIAAEDLSIFSRSKCYDYNTLDPGEGKSFQWVPQSQQIKNKPTLSNGKYSIEVALATSEKPVCEWEPTSIAIGIESTRTPYLPTSLHFEIYDSSNSNHNKVDLNNTKIICSLEKDIEVCRVTPLHDKSNHSTILLPDNLDQEFTLNFELK